MGRRRVKNRNLIWIVICIVLAGALACMLLMQNRQEKAQSAAMQAILDEAQPYEEEQQELKDELSNLKKNISYTSEEAEILVGFVATEASDISDISDWASAYGFSPVLIIDCTMETDVIGEIVEAADESWEIMLYTPAFSEAENENVLAVMADLEDMGREYADVFFLRDDYCTSSNIRRLQEDGFIGYTRYNGESPSSGQTDDGIVYFDYHYMSTTDTGVEDRVSASYSNKASIMVALDMEGFHYGTLPDDYITELMDFLQDYAEEDDCSFSTITDVVEELSNANAIEADNQANYEEEAAEIQEQIDELQEIIDEIYDQME